MDSATSVAALVASSAEGLAGDEGTAAAAASLGGASPAAAAAEAAAPAPLAAPLGVWGASFMAAAAAAAPSAVAMVAATLTRSRCGTPCTPVPSHTLFFTCDAPRPTPAHTPHSLLHLLEARLSADGDPKLDGELLLHFAFRLLFTFVQDLLLFRTFLPVYTLPPQRRLGMDFPTSSFSEILCFFIRRLVGEEEEEAEPALCLSGFGTEKGGGG